MSPDASGTPAEVLARLGEQLEGCERCTLCKRRRNVVFGEGDPAARRLFVGEGPGEQEDKTGRPFVGPAGQLRTKIIEAMGLKREQVYIANVVKCRPPGNRVPTFEEVRTCAPFLRRQVDLIQPEVIVALGGTAARRLLERTDGSMRQFRGSWHEAYGVPLYCTYHPAYLLRTPSEKRKVWEDMKVVMRRLGLAAR